MIYVTPHPFLFLFNCYYDHSICVKSVYIVSVVQSVVYLLSLLSFSFSLQCLSIVCEISINNILPSDAKLNSKHVLSQLRRPLPLYACGIASSECKLS